MKKYKIVKDGKKFAIKVRGFLGFGWFEYPHNPEHYPRRFKKKKKAKKFILNELVDY